MISDLTGRTLLKRFQTVDPGGVRLVRGVHLTLCMILAGLAGYSVRFLAPDLGIPDLSVYSTATAGLTQVFMQPGTRLGETRRLLFGGLVFTAVLSLAIPMFLLGATPNGITAELVWVALITFGFYLRRFGAVGEKMGIIIAIAWLFIVAVKPPLSVAYWLPLAGLLGTLVGAAAKAVFWRPSALKVFRSVERSHLETIAGVLKQAMSGILPSEEDVGFLTHDLKQGASELALAGEAARQAGQVREEQVLAVLVRATKLQLALEVFVEAFGRLSDEARTALIRAPGFKKRVSGIVAALETGECHAADNGKNGLEWLTQEHRRTSLDVFRFLRVRKALQRLSSLCEETSLAGAGAEETPAGGAVQPGQFPAWRLAAQAFVAAAITVAIAEAFHLNHAYWATMTVIFVLCNSLGATVKRAFERAVGTALGVAVALLCYLSFFHLPVFQIATVLLVFPFLFVAVERNYLIGAGIIGFVVVMGLHILVGGGWETLLARVYETAIGAAAGFAVSWLILPIQSAASVHQLFNDLMAQCQTVTKPTHRAEGEGLAETQGLISRAADVAAQFKSFQNERMVLSNTSSRGVNFICRVEVLVDYVCLFLGARAAVRQDALTVEDLDLISHLETLVQDGFSALKEQGAFPVVDGLTERWRTVLDASKDEDLDQIADMVDVLYFGKKIIVSLERLKDDPVYRIGFAKAHIAFSKRQTLPAWLE